MLRVIHTSMDISNRIFSPDMTMTFRRHTTLHFWKTAILIATEVVLFSDCRDPNEQCRNKILTCDILICDILDFPGISQIGEIQCNPCALFRVGQEALEPRSAINQ